MRHPFRRLTVDLFTQGDCGDLAVRLHELTGWPICGVRDGSGDELAHALRWTKTWTHAVVRTPAGLYLDVTGARSAANLKRNWLGQLVDRPAGRTHQAALAEVRSVWESPHDEYTPEQRRARACIVARRVLTLYAQRPEAHDFVPASWWTHDPDLIGMG